MEDTTSLHSSFGNTFSGICRSSAWGYYYVMKIMASHRGVDGEVKHAICFAYPWMPDIILADVLKFHFELFSQRLFKG